MRNNKPIVNINSIFVDNYSIIRPGILSKTVLKDRSVFIKLFWVKFGTTSICHTGGICNPRAQGPCTINEETASNPTRSIVGSGS
jgi:hypothetical protein